MFWIALAICTLFVLYGAFYAQTIGNRNPKHYFIYSKEFSWYYLLLVFTHILCLCVFIVSRYASITLGEEGEDPEFFYHLGLRCYLVLVWDWTSILTTAEPISHAFTLTPIHKRVLNLQSMMHFNFVLSLGITCMGSIWNCSISLCIF